MRRPSIFTQRGRGLDVEMTPMIDVVFLLLVFFIWTASFQIVENVIRVGVIDNPAGVGSVPPILDLPPNDVVIESCFFGRAVRATSNGRG